MMSDGLSCPRTFSPLLSLETSRVHVAELFRIRAVYFLLWCILFVFAHSSYRMSVPDCLLWCVQVITTRREDSRRRSMTRQDPAWESAGGVNAHPWCQYFISRS